MQPLIVVLGPTGSGKTDLALSIAQIFDGEIVGCDSLQIYRHFNLGTAKTPLEERCGIPHHLIDVVNPDQSFTAGDYARTGRSAIADISALGRLPIVVGGTGFYLRALLDGLFPGPERDEQLRERLVSREKRRAGFLHRCLRRFDPVSASRIHQNDLNKLIRAIEVSTLGGRPMSAQLEAGRDRLTGYRVVKLGLAPARDLLNQRLDRRLERMFENGLLEEVERILAKGYSRAVKPFESLGYKEALAVLEGRMNKDDALAAAQLATRQYAKRQRTWFRRERDVLWMEGFGEQTAIQAKALEFIKNAMSQ